MVNTMTKPKATLGGRDLFPLKLWQALKQELRDHEEMACSLYKQRPYMPRVVLPTKQSDRGSS